VALVLQTMPELQELCATPDLALSMEHVKVDDPVILSLPERLDVGSTPISPWPPPNSDALFAEKICDLLNKLDVVIPGLGRAIACLLSGTTLKGKSQKVSSDRYPEEEEATQVQRQQEWNHRKDACGYLMDDLC
jgi:hypothetical protein